MKINLPNEITITPEMIVLAGKILLTLLTILVGIFVVYKVKKYVSIKNIIGKNKLKVKQSGEKDSYSKASVKNVIGSNEIDIKQDNRK